MSFEDEIKQWESVVVARIEAKVKATVDGGRWCLAGGQPAQSLCLSWNSSRLGDRCHGHPGDGTVHAAGRLAGQAHTTAR